MTSIHARFFDLSLELLATANTDGYFVDLNPAWTLTLGYSLDELRKQPFIDMVHPDDREATNRESARLLAGELTIHFENRYRSKDGSYKWFAWTARFSREDSLMFACARDITSAKRMLADKEQAIGERDRFKALAKNTSDFIGMTSLDGYTTYLNPAGKRLLGASDLELSKLTVRDWYPPAHADRVMREGIPHASEHDTWASDGTLMTRDGRLIPISQVIVALRSLKGELTGYATIIRDLSAIDSFKRMEQELRDQQAVLREMLHAMATPIIPITEDIVVMPLIGTMDSDRAEQFLESALKGAEMRRARVVIIDITGLRHIDTGVAGTLIRASAALKLLGAQVVLTGIRAEIARTLVGLGVDLATLITHSTLQSGITYALRSLGESFHKDEPHPRFAL